MGISKKLSNILSQVQRPDYGKVKNLVIDAYPQLDDYVLLETCRGIYAVKFSEDFSQPDAFRYQMEHWLGDAPHFQQWFSLTAVKRLELYVQVELYVHSLPSGYTKERVECFIYQLLDELSSCESCGHQIEDPCLGDICAACYHEQFEPSGCDHCGDTEATLDDEDLCSICSHEQYLYDTGKCPTCETPSPGSRACASC